MSQPTWEQQAAESDTFKPDDDTTVMMPKWETDEGLTEIPKWNPEAPVNRTKDEMLEAGLRAGLRAAEVKPMRIRYMELPLELNGDKTEMPFVIVIDRMGDNWRNVTQEDIDGTVQATGARGVLFFEFEVEIGAL